MKHTGWIAGGSILGVVVAALEVVYHLKGGEFVTTIASACVFLVAGVIIWRIAAWADRELGYTKK